MLKFSIGDPQLTEKSVKLHKRRPSKQFMVAERRTCSSTHQILACTPNSSGLRALTPTSAEASAPWHKESRSPFTHCSKLLWTRRAKKPMEMDAVFPPKCGRCLSFITMKRVDFTNCVLSETWLLTSAGVTKTLLVSSDPFVALKKLKIWLNDANYQSEKNSLACL